jgi:hypothetical protein
MPGNKVGLLLIHIGEKEQERKGMQSWHGESRDITRIW